MPRKISQLPTTLTAANATPAQVYFGIDDTGDNTSKKFSLAELHKTNEIRVVANVAAMQAVTDAVDNQLFQTLGYSTEGVGANLYRYDAASSATHDGGFVITATGMGAGRFIAVDQTVADVTKFGAVGNGVANDTAAIQAAISSAGTYSHVLIPDGEYVVSDNIVPLTGQTVTFVGELKLDDGGVALSGALLRLSNPDITLINPRINYDASNNTSDGTPGTQATIDNYGTGNNCRIIGGLLRNNMDNGLAGGKNGLFVDRLRIESTGEHAIYLNGLDANGSGLHATDITLSNLVIKDVGTDSSRTEGHCVQLKNCESVKINGGYYDCGTSATIPTFFCLADNIDSLIWNGGEGVNCNHTGMIFDANCSDIQISNFTGRVGTLLGASKTFIRSLAARTSVSNCTWDGFSSTDRYPDLIDSCWFINVPTAIHITGKRAVFRNCHFTFTAGNTNWMRIDDSATVEGCTFYGNIANPGTDYAIWISSSNTKQVMFVDNEFPDWTASRMMLVNGGIWHHIIGNKLPLANAVDVIRISAASTAAAPCVIRDNYIPLSAGGGIWLNTSTSAQTQMPSQIVQSAAPTTGYWSQGNVVFNSQAVAGGTVGWVCTVSGNPGTWKAFGAIAP